MVKLMKRKSIDARLAQYNGSAANSNGDNTITITKGLSTRDFKIFDVSNEIETFSLVLEVDSEYPKRRLNLVRTYHRMRNSADINLQE